MQSARVSLASVLASGLAIVLTLATGCGRNAAQNGTSGAPPVQTQVVAEKNSFAEVTSHLDPGGNLYMYLGTAQWLDGLSAKVGAWRDTVQSLPNLKDADRENVARAFDLATNLIKDSGIEDVSGFGMSSIAVEKGFYRTRMVLHHYKGQGTGFLWSVFGAAPHKLDGLDLLPATTAFASFGDADLSMLWSAVEKDITQSGIPAADEGIAQAKAAFEQKTGLKLDDLLASLGGEYGVVLTLNDAKKITVPAGLNQTFDFPEPGILVAAKVKDDLIFNRVDELLKGGHLPVAESDTNGLRMRTVTIPVPLPIALRPSIARSGDYLFLATSDSLIEQVLDVQSGKQPGLKSTDEFKKLAQGLPDQGNHFTFVSRRFGETWIDIQGQIADRASESNPAQAELMKRLARLSPPTFAYNVAVNTDEGWMVTGNGNQDTAKLVLIPAVAMPAIVAGVTLPALAKAKAKAQNVNCANNLRAIQNAKSQWASENGKSGDDTPTWADIKPYLRGTKIPKCPAGGEYKLNAVNQQPTCSVHSHSDD
jgi:hypothetical protein